MENYILAESYANLQDINHNTMSLGWYHKGSEFFHNCVSWSKPGAELVTYVDIENGNDMKLALGEVHNYKYNILMYMVAK